MSEQVATLKGASKTKGKANPLAGLLKAGGLDDKDGKEFLKKLNDITKKADELAKIATASKSKKETKAEKTTKDAEALDEEALVNIKNFLSSIKLNDKIALEKSIKDLRDTASRLEGKKGDEASAIKKLLELAKDGGVNLKKLAVETIEEEEGSETAGTDGKKSKKTAKTETKTETKSDGKVETKSDNKTDAKTAIKAAAEKAETAKAESLSTAKTAQTIAANAVATMSAVDPKELLKEIAKEANLANMLQELKKDKKEQTTDAKKDVKKEVAAKLESAKESLLSELKLQNEALTSAEIAAKKEAVKTMFLESVSELVEKEVEAKKESGLEAALLEAPKEAKNELKGKMAIASEALKNFSSDMKELIESYKPPLMKVSMVLNPENLGGVDVTLITRGQNLVVNVTSSQETMQMFMQNIAEFKQNLAAQGFVSLQMNFNFSEGNQEQNNKQWQKEATKKYQINGEDMSATAESLDIIMPHPKYA